VLTVGFEPTASLLQVKSIDRYATLALPAYVLSNDHTTILCVFHAAEKVEVLCPIELHFVSDAGRELVSRVFPFSLVRQAPSSNPTKSGLEPESSPSSGYWGESNPQRSHCKCDALPIELQSHRGSLFFRKGRPTFLSVLLDTHKISPVGFEPTLPVATGSVPFASSSWARRILLTTVPSEGVEPTLTCS